MRNHTIKLISTHLFDELVEKSPNVVFEIPVGKHGQVFTVKNGVNREILCRGNTFVPHRRRHHYLIES
jgi:hypothetical protein